MIEAFDEVRALPPVLPADLREAVYRWLPTFAGLAAADAPQRGLGILTPKIAKGLL